MLFFAVSLKNLFYFNFNDNFDSLRNKRDRAEIVELLEKKTNIDNLNKDY